MDAALGPSKGPIDGVNIGVAAQLVDAGASIER
jgi:hypothetical protein